MSPSGLILFCFLFRLTDAVLNNLTTCNFIPNGYPPAIPYTVNITTCAQTCQQNRQCFGFHVDNSGGSDECAYNEQSPLVPTVSGQYWMKNVLLPSAAYVASTTWLSYRNDSADPVAALSELLNTCGTCNETSSFAPAVRTHTAGACPYYTTNCPQTSLIIYYRGDISRTTAMYRDQYDLQNKIICLDGRYVVISSHPARPWVVEATQSQCLNGSNFECPVDIIDPSLCLAGEICLGDWAMHASGYWDSGRFMFPIPALTLASQTGALTIRLRLFNGNVVSETAAENMTLFCDNHTWRSSSTGSRINGYLLIKK